MSKDIWLLIPVHNRRETTRSCLRNLEALAIQSKFTVCVIDDGCSDGTSEMLAREFRWVRVLRGDGSLFWGGAIAEGMRVARDSHAEIHVWLNDDCRPAPGAIEALVTHVRQTKGLCGAVSHDPDDPEKITYSGARAGVAGVLAPPQGCNEPADVLNGNLVAVHCDVVEQLGVVDAARFPHYGADIEYCIRAKRAGIPTEISGDARATNRRDNPLSRFGINKPSHHIFLEPCRIGSPIYWPAYWRILKLTFGWKAYFRWPAYLFRLVQLWQNARRVERKARGIS